MVSIPAPVFQPTVGSWQLGNTVPVGATDVEDAARAAKKPKIRDAVDEARERVAGVQTQEQQRTTPPSDMSRTRLRRMVMVNW